jgi:prepilin-type N-terminal cleavage/methylation domain-containing protein
MTHGQRGFTLVELLIAMVLLAFLTAMLAGGLDVATRRYQSQYDRLERAQRVLLVQNFLRAQLAGARRVSDPAGSARANAFDGAPQGVRFVATGPESVNAGGLADLAVEFAPEAKDTRGALVVRWRPFGAANAAASRDSVLLDRVRRLDFAYFGTAASNEAPDWHPTWQKIAGLPSLVRLSLEFDDGETMPELFIAVETSAGAPGG